MCGCTVIYSFCDIVPIVDLFGGKMVGAGKYSGHHISPSWPGLDRLMKSVFRENALLIASSAYFSIPQSCASNKRAIDHIWLAASLALQHAFVAKAPNTFSKHDKTVLQRNLACHVRQAINAALHAAWYNIAIDHPHQRTQHIPSTCLHG